LNITYNFLYCNHQVHRDFLIILFKLSWLDSHIPPLLCHTLYLI